MSNIIAFPARSPPGERRHTEGNGPPAGHDAEILFFTGIRYSRRPSKDRDGFPAGDHRLEKLEG